MDKLPEELRLLIISFISPADLWLSVRHINNQYKRYAEEVVTKEHVPAFTVGLSFSLTSGSHHRWFDVRGTLHSGYKYMNKLNPQYALFETLQVHPPNYENRIMEKWKQMCASGVGTEQEWRVTFGGTGLLMKMPNLVMSASDGIWCDWREMLDGYFERLPQVWDGYAKNVL